MAKKEDRFVVRYQVSDGYMGGSRPQTFHVDPDDIPPGATEVQIEGLLYDLAQEDMLQKVSADVDNADDFLTWAKEQAAKAA